MRDGLVTARRVGWRLGLMDLSGHVLGRDEPGSGTSVASPSPRTATPARLRVADLVTMPLEGEPDADLGLGLGFSLAVLRNRTDVAAVAAGTPHDAMALGSVRREILPLTHTGAEVALAGGAWIDAEQYALVGDDADAVARSIGDAGFVHVPGVAVLAFGSEPLDAIRRLDVLETLARMTIIATRLDSRPTTVTPSQAEAVSAQRPVERRPSRDYRRYYRSLDRPPPIEAGPAPEDGGVDRVRRDVALACRILARQGGLVAFFEHVSHRIAGQDDRFAMSPAKDFAAMEPADICTIATAGDCAQLDGEIPAAPFRWYHRDLLERRADVNAIVHTHPMYGRAYDLADTVAPPVHRYAVHGMAGEAPPTFVEPSLLFDEADRAEMLELLADGPWVHARGHGTDYCAPDIATATVTAIHHEQHLRFHSLATSLGGPTVLDRRALELISAHGPAPERWWAAYADALAA